MSEEPDIELYLAEMRQKLQNYNLWDDTWMIQEEERDNERPAQE